MKLFKKKKEKPEQPLSEAPEYSPDDYLPDGMPAPPSVPSSASPRQHGSRRNLPQDSPRGYVQQQTARHSAGQQYQQPQYQQQQYQQQPPPPQQHHQQGGTAYRPSNRQSREEMHDSYPPQQAKQDHYPQPARQAFEPTQIPPAKETEAPPSLNVDPVIQMERAAITRELVKQYVADIWNRGDLDLIPKVCARGLRFNGSAGMDRVGHAGFSRMVQTIRGSLEDYHCEIHSMVVEGNKAFCRMRFTGRHVGQLLGYEGTGKHVSWMGASEFTVVDGLIVKVWELGDMSSLEHQLRQATGGGGGGRPSSESAAEGQC